MRKLMITLAAAAALAGAGASLWQAQAANFQDPALTSKLRNYTPLQPAACRGWGPWCPPGRTRVCNAWRCWCAVC
jgi:hypothetical protein